MPTIAEIIAKNNILIDQSEALQILGWKNTPGRWKQLQELLSWQYARIAGMERYLYREADVRAFAEPKPCPACKHVHKPEDA